MNPMIQQFHLLCSIEQKASLFSLFPAKCYAPGTISTPQIFNFGDERARKVERSRSRNERAPNKKRAAKAALRSLNREASNRMAQPFSQIQKNWICTVITYKA